MSAERGVDFSAFLSTPSARRATADLAAAIDRIHISIHALREEGDQNAAVASVGGIGISIHALREEGDTSRFGTNISETNFYPRPPRGGRPPNNRLIDNQFAFLSTPSARRATYEPCNL